MKFNERHILAPDYLSDICVFRHTYRSVRYAYIDFKNLYKGRKDWSSKRASILRMLTFLKFTQHSEAAKALMLTKGEELIYSPTYYDSFLGIGDGDGKNMYGKFLMEIRDFLDMWNPLVPGSKEYPVVYSNFYTKGYDRHIVEMFGKRYEFDQDLDAVVEICACEDLITGEKSQSSIRILSNAVEECFSKNNGDDLFKLVVVCYLRNIGLEDVSDLLRYYWGC